MKEHYSLVIFPVITFFRLLQDFFTMLGTDPDRAFYGYKHVRMAANNSAVEALLVCDSLFR